MSDELPIRITSVFTLAENKPKTSKNGSEENLSGKTEQCNPSVWQNFEQQWCKAGSLKDGQANSLNDVYCSSKELMRLAAKQGKNKDASRGSVSVTESATETENNTKSLPTNTMANTDISGDNYLGNAATDNIYTVFRVTKDACPSFCCQYSPALLATLRARATKLNPVEINTKAPDRLNFTVANTSTVSNE